MTDNLDDLKKQWQEMSAKLDKLDDANKQLSEQLSKSHVATYQETLSRRIRLTSIVGFLLPLLSFVLYFEIHLPLWICILYAVYGLLMGAVWLWYSYFVGHVSLLSLPLKEAYQRAIKIKERQTQLRILGVVSGVIVLFLLGYYIDPGLWIAFLIGAVLGLIVAIIKAISAARLARKMVESLQE